jgi:hypothetical protein
MSMRPGRSVIPGRSTCRGVRRGGGALRAHGADTAVGDGDLRVVHHFPGDHVEHAIRGDDDGIGMSGGAGGQEQGQEDSGDRGIFIDLI